MRARLREIWSGRRVALTGADDAMTRWTRAMLAALGAEVVAEMVSIQGEPRGWSAEALRSAVAERRTEVWICAFVPRADTADALGDALTQLHESLTGFRDAGGRCALLMLSDAVYRDDDAPWACLEASPLGGRDADGCAQSCLRLLAESFRRGSLGKPIPVTVAHHNKPTCGGMPGGPPVHAWMDGLAAGEPGLSARFARPMPFQHALEPIAGALLAAGQALTHPPREGDTWNLGAPAGNWLSPHAACRALAGLLDPRAATAPPGAKAGAPTPEWAHAPARPPACLDSERARMELGWRTVYDAEDTLRLLAAWQATAQTDGEAAALAAQTEAFLEDSERIRD